MRPISWMLSLGMLLLGGLSACTTPPALKNSAAEAIRHEMDTVAREKQAKDMVAVDKALLPPLAMVIPKVNSKLQEPRFDLAVNNTPASQVFMAIASGTRYNMLVPPEVTGNISLNLKDVTVVEALDAIRDLYGYDYRISGNRIYIQPIALQTRIFHVSYLTSIRTGTSALTVESGSGSSTGAGAGAGAGSTSTPGGTGSTVGTGGGMSKSSVITMTDPKVNFWRELQQSLDAIVGHKDGRSVVINSMSGVIVVRAMPDEMKDVMDYLRASQISIERQVILEAKIVEVQLNDGFQSGVNWGAFKAGLNSAATLGQISPGGTLASLGTNMTDGTLAIAGNAMSAGNGSGSGTLGTMFGLAFQTSNFAAMLDFLETQGNVHVLSSPRIATLNNQKAILKVGTDQYYITGFTNTPATTINNVTTPGTTTATYTPMFSGIALDVTPSINEDGDIILHVHPSVSQITSQNVPVASGGTVPMALTSVSETDSVVRAHDGQIVVIGGLMRQATFDDDSGLPGLPKTVFGHTNKRTEKRELILLLKSTVVDSDLEWSDDIEHSRSRIDSLVETSRARR